MIKISNSISHFDIEFPECVTLAPWTITTNMMDIVKKKISTLGNDYVINDFVAIHKTAKIEERVIIKGPAIIGPDCFIGSNAYLRNGVFLGRGSSVGPACEVKTSMIFEHTEVAHLNFIGDSIIGSHVNLEAGSISANYYNEREDKTIYVLYDGEIIRTDAQKFGSLIGDRSKIGANAVLSPGTILQPGTVVKRLELVEQVRETDRNV